MERTSTYSVLVGKSEGKRPLGRSGLRWQDNIKTDIQVVRSGIDLNFLAQHRGRRWIIFNALMNRWLQ
jgi:hypothetical protein